ncbi:ABC transporter-like protein [Cryptosporidium canis]|uniref:ABC transporter-like protein n=1 Tax=Cryptosporidium canis TaxID=195482 RepID=A0ABQ8P3N9_9CRYT|nr:ABC transporter-like protein [Cryptosporidium canis]
MEEDQNTRSGSSLQSLGPTGITVLNIFFTVSSIRGLPSNMIEGFISLRRFQEFLQNTQSRAADSFLAPETPTSRCPLLEDDLVLDFKGSRVAKSAPEPNQSCERLEETKPMIEGDCPSRLKSHTFFNDLSLRVKKREKVFLIGEPGSGKTTFVQEVLLNHHLMLNTQHKHGYFYYNYHLLKKLPIGYVSQIPWIPSGTVRSIILFGSEYDEDQYKRIIECCNLTTDFEQWKEGDLKQVDEGGGSLSKGQKTRVCIARALYHFFSSKELRRHCPLFIFDDVFSNLDQFVANKLFYSLLGSNGVLSGSSVLITIDQRSLSTFLKYASSLDSGSSFSLYSSFQFISIQGFNCSKRPFLEPQQALAGSAESALADTHIGTLMNNNGSMIFSPRDSSSTPSTSCPSSSYVMDLGCTPEASPQTSESDRLIPQNCSHTISYTKENVANKGHISLDSYLWYLSNTGKSFIVALLIISLCKSGLERLSEILFTGESTHTQTLQKFLLLYSLSTSLSLLLGGLVFLLEAIACTFGANSIHRRIFEALHVKVPNVIPVHIMLNRIGGDMLVVDTCIVKSIFSCLAPVLTIVGQTVFIVYTFPYFTPCFLVWVMLVIRPICQTFISSYREYQRFSISLFSSICGIFSGTQHGGSVITMLRKQETLKAQASESIDLYIKAKCIQLASTQWAGFWMNMAMTPIGILLNVLFFRFGDGSKSGSAIICIYYFLSIAEFISSLMYKFVQLEKEMCSVERIKDYIGVVNRLNERIIQMGESCRGAALGGGGPEAAAAEERSGPPRSREAVCGPQGSPSLGSCSMEGLVIQDLQVSTISQSSVGGELNNEFVDGLRFETLLSIHGTLRALPGSVIGIIGRTGSGKSSLVNSIIGLHLQTKGAILLNNVETRTISQKNKIIGLLPQESFLMEGATIRSLLDPFSEHSDDQLLRALDNAGLAEFIQLLPSKLETTIVPQDPGGAATDYSLTGIPGSSSMAIKLSNSQIRYLYFIQFTISPNKLQLLLADEPPLNVTFSFGSLTFATPSIHNIIGSTFKHCPCLIITHNMDIFNNCDAFWIIKNNQLLKVLQRLPGNAPNLTCTEIP